MISVPLGLINLDQANMPNPAPGVDFDYALFAGMSHFIVAVEYKLTTDATVVDRYLGLIVNIRSMLNHEYYLRYSNAVPANSSLTANWMIGITSTDVQPSVNNHQSLTMICPLYLFSSDRIKSHVEGMVAGDQVSDIWIYEYMFPTT